MRTRTFKLIYLSIYLYMYVCMYLCISIYIYISISLSIYISRAVAALHSGPATKLNLINCHSFCCGTKQETRGIFVSTCWGGFVHYQIIKCPDCGYCMEKFLKTFVPTARAVSISFPIRYVKQNKKLKKVL